MQFIYTRTVGISDMQQYGYISKRQMYSFAVQCSCAPNFRSWSTGAKSGVGIVVLHKA